jgi:hypothetical protein
MRSHDESLEMRIGMAPTSLILVQTVSHDYGDGEVGSENERVLFVSDIQESLM